MGQYYRIMVNNQVYESFVDGQHMMCKLMEHSYIDNQLVLAISSKLWRKSAKIAWIGDYAGNDDKNWNPRFEKAWGNDKALKTLKWNGFSMTGTILINHTKKEFIRIDDYIAQVESRTRAKCKDELFIIHPLPILTSVGNGKGGGDYHGCNEKLAGTWADDDLMIVPDYNNEFFVTEYNFDTKQHESKLKPEYADYSDVTAKTLFKEA